MNLKEPSTNLEEMFLELWKLQSQEIAFNYDVIEQLILLYPNDDELGKEIRRIYNQLNK